MLRDDYNKPRNFCQPYVRIISKFSQNIQINEKSRSRAVFLDGFYNTELLNDYTDQASVAVIYNALHGFLKL